MLEAGPSKLVAAINREQEWAEMIGIYDSRLHRMCGDYAVSRKADHFYYQLSQIIPR